MIHGDKSGFVEMTEIDGHPAIRGDCDHRTARHIELWLATLDTQIVDVDLRDVTFFDSSALRAFMNIKRRNPRFRVVNPSTVVVRVFDISDTLEYFLGVTDNVS